MPPPEAGINPFPRAGILLLPGKKEEGTFPLDPSGFPSPVGNGERRNRSPVNSRESFGHQMLPQSHGGSMRETELHPWILGYLQLLLCHPFPVPPFSSGRDFFGSSHPIGSGLLDTRNGWRRPSPQRSGFCGKLGIPGMCTVLGKAGRGAG